VAFERGAPPRDTPVYRREDVGPASLAGPAIVESYDSTVVVPPGWAMAADDRGNLVLTTAR
jgi:N-methylhydantoinase A